MEDNDPFILLGNTVAADDLATQGAKASADGFSCNIMASQIFEYCWVNARKT